MADDPRFVGYPARQQHVDEIRGIIEAAFADRDVEEIFQDAQLWRLPFGLILSPQESLQLTPHTERGYFVSQEYPEIGAVRTPRVPFIMSATPSAPYAAPALGEHSDEILRQA